MELLLQPKQDPFAGSQPNRNPRNTIGKLHRHWKPTVDCQVSDLAVRTSDQGFCSEWLGEVPVQQREIPRRCIPLAAQDQFDIAAADPGVSPGCFVQGFVQGPDGLR